MSNKEVRQVDEYAIVRQSNELVEANYRLSMAEQKVILNFIAQLDTTQKNFTVGRIKPSHCRMPVASMRNLATDSCRKS